MSDRVVCFNLACSIYIPDSLGSDITARDTAPEIYTFFLFYMQVPCLTPGHEGKENPFLYS